MFYKVYNKYKLLKTRLRILRTLQARNQIKKLFQYGIGQLFNVAAPFIIIPFIILKCGEENFGKSAIGMSIAFFIIVFVDFGSDVLGVKDISINRDSTQKRNYIISRVVYIKCFFTVLFGVLYLIIINKLAFFQQNKELYYYSIPIFIAQIVNPLWVFQGLEKFYLFSYFSILSKSIYILLIFYFVNQKSDFIYINLAFGLSIFIAGTFFFFVLHKYHHFCFVSISFSELFKYMFNNKVYVLSQIFIWVQLYSPILLINYFGTSLQVGQFRIIDQIISIFKTYILLSFNFIYPRICFEFQINQNKAIKSWKVFNFFNFAFLLSLLIIVFLFSSEIINYYNILNKMYLNKILKVALIYPLLFFVVYALKQILFARHYEKVFSRIIIATSIFNLIIIAMLFKKYNLFGVFYSFISIELLTLAMLVIVTFKYKTLDYKNSTHET